MYFVTFLYDASYPIIRYPRYTFTLGGNRMSKQYCHHDRDRNFPVLGQSLVESGRDFENAVAAVLGAEANKINALVDAKVCPKQLIEANELLKDTVCCIADLEKLILTKIILGILIAHHGLLGDNFTPETLANNINLKDVANIDDVSDLSKVLEALMNNKKC